MVGLIEFCDLDHSQRRSDIHGETTLLLGRLALRTNLDVTTLALEADRDLCLQAKRKEHHKFPLAIEIKDRLQVGM